MYICIFVKDVIIEKEKIDMIMFYGFGMRFICLNVFMWFWFYLKLEMER